MRTRPMLRYSYNFYLPKKKNNKIARNVDSSDDKQQAGKVHFHRVISFQKLLRLSAAACAIKMPLTYRFTFIATTKVTLHYEWHGGQST